MSGASSDSEGNLFDDEDSGSETEFEEESESDSVHISDTESNEDSELDDSGSTVLLLSSNENDIDSESETDIEEVTEEGDIVQSRQGSGLEVAGSNNNDVVLVGRNSQNIANTISASNSMSTGRQSIMTDSNVNIRTNRADTGSNVNEGAGPSRLSVFMDTVRPSQLSSTGPSSLTSQTVNQAQTTSQTIMQQNLTLGSEQTISSSRGPVNQSETRPTEQPTNQIGEETIYVQEEEVELMQVEVQTVVEASRNSSPAVVGEPSRNESLKDFKSPKKPATTTSTTDDGNISDDDAETCIICYEPWTNSGLHRLTSLKCGHLFGQSCIEKWLKGQGGKCPQCNAKAKKSDVRVIYAKALRTIDTSDKDRALKDLEKEKVLRRKMELEAAQMNLKYQMAMEELNRMKTQMKTQQGMARNHASSPFSSSQPSTSSSSSTLSGANMGKGIRQGQYVLDKAITISQNGNCRVMAFDEANYSLVVSMPSSNQLFPGFGIKKISAMDIRNTQYVPVHSKMIRDIDFNSRHDGLMLTASIDKTVKITSLAGNTVVQSYNTEMPAWCCAWNTEDVNYIYAGLQNGTVRIYDTRQTSSEVETLNKEGSRCPIVSLNYVPAAPGTSFWSSGLLTGTLEGTTFWEKLGAAEYRPQKLLDGNCTCLNFDPVTRHCMASFRPNKSHPATRHVMCELKSTRTGASNEALVTCNTVQTMYGGTTMKLLTKSTLYDDPARQGQLLVAAGDEASCSAIVWDASTGSQAQKLPINSTVLDVCPFSFNRQNYLACLTEKHVKLFRWQAQAHS